MTTIGRLRVWSVPTASTSLPPWSKYSKIQETSSSRPWARLWTTRQLEQGDCHTSRRWMDDKSSCTMWPWSQRSLLVGRPSQSRMRSESTPVTSRHTMQTSTSLTRTPARSMSWPPQTISARLTIYLTTQRTITRLRWIYRKWDRVRLCVSGRISGACRMRTIMGVVHCLIRASRGMHTRLKTPNVDSLLTKMTSEHLGKKVLASCIISKGDHTSILIR